MRTTEGKGLVAPAPVLVRLDMGDLASAKKWTRDRLRARGYEANTDEWKSGLIGAYRAVLVGFVGEIAFAKWASAVTGLPIEPDTAPRWGGDGGTDFTVCGYAIQVKTATADYGDLLIRTQDAAAPDWEIVVRVQWPPRRRAVSGAALFAIDDRADRTGAELCGWAYERHFARLARLEPGRAGAHSNYALAPEQLLPMGDLAALFVARLARFQRSP
jgi:hypothetical protein